MSLKSAPHNRNLFHSNYILYRSTSADFNSRPRPGRFKSAQVFRYLLPENHQKKVVLFLHDRENILR